MFRKNRLSKYYVRYSVIVFIICMLLFWITVSVSLKCITHVYCPRTCRQVGIYTIIKESLQEVSSSFAHYRN